MADAKTAVMRARALLRDKRYAEALRLCTSELSQGSTDPQIRLIAAQCLVAQGRYEGAKKWADLAIRQNPREVDAYRILADVASRKGEMSTTRAYLERIVELDPTDSRSRALLESLSSLSVGQGGDLYPNTVLMPQSMQDQLKAASLDEEEDEEDRDPSFEELLLQAPKRSAEVKEPEETGTEQEVIVEVSAEELLTPSPEMLEVEEADSEEEKEAFVDPFSGVAFKVTDSMVVGEPEPVEEEEEELDLRTPMPDLATQRQLQQQVAATASSGDRRFPTRAPTILGHPGATREPGLPAPSEPARPGLPAMPEPLKPSLPAPPEPQEAATQKRRRKTLSFPSMEEPPPAGALASPPVLQGAMTMAPHARPRDQGEQEHSKQPRRATLHLPLHDLGMRPGGMAGAAQLEDIEVEPADAPEELPPLSSGARAFDPLLEVPESGGGRPAVQAAEAPSDPLDLLWAGRESPAEEARPAGMARTAPSAAPRKPARPAEPVARPGPGERAEPSVEVADELMSMLTGGVVSGEIGEEEPQAPLADPYRAMESTDHEAVETAGELDMEQQLIAAGLARPGGQERNLLRWFVVGAAILALGGGGIFGYLWYRSYKLVKEKWQVLQQKVYRSTSASYREAIQAARKIIDERGGADARASAAMGMCQAAMAIEFGDNQLEPAKKSLALSKGTDSEWRTAAHAYLALVEEPAGAAGYLMKGLEVYPESAILHYLKGRALRESGSPGRAAQSLQQALKLAPDYVAAKIAAAVLAGQEAEGFAEAISGLDALLGKDPTNVQALVERARLRTRHNKELVRAAEDARRVAGELASRAVKGQVGWSHLILAQVAGLQGQHAVMSRELDQAARTPPCCFAAFHFELAGGLMSLYRMADAYAQMRRALELKPQQAEYLQRMARVLLELDDPRQAHTFLQTAPARSTETRLLLGRLAYVQHDPAKAEGLLSQVLAEAPQLVEAALYLALARARQKKLTAAASALEELAGKHPAQHEVFQALAQVRLWMDQPGRAHAALKTAWKITKLDPHTPVLAARMYLEQHDYKTAEKRLRRALKVRPEHRRALVGLARVLLHSGRIEEAKKELGRILEHDRDRPDVIALQARMALVEGSLEVARAGIEQVVRADGPPEVVARLTGELALAAGQPDEAIAALQRAAKLSLGRDADLEVLLGRAQAAAGRLDDAFSTFQGALRKDEGHPVALLELSRIAITDREFGIAADRLGQALQRMKERSYPDRMKAAVYSALGRVYLLQKDTGRAITNLQDAIALDGTAGEPRYTMGQTYQQLDRPGKAREYYLTALKLGPPSEEIFERLGQVCDKLGNKQEALQHYEEYLKHDPPDYRAQRAKLEIRRLKRALRQP